MRKELTKLKEKGRHRYEHMEKRNRIFSKLERHYEGCYLEIDEVYDEELEVSLFSLQKGPYEIYIS